MIVPPAFWLRPLNQERNVMSSAITQSQIVWSGPLAADIVAFQPQHGLEGPVPVVIIDPLPPGPVRLQVGLVKAPGDNDPGLCLDHPHSVQAGLWLVSGNDLAWKSQYSLKNQDSPLAHSFQD